MRQWARQPADQRYESTHLFWTICPARSGGVGLATTITVKQGERVILVPKPDTVERAIATTREWVG
ncbi:MAG: hypothetical protein BroJett024_40100 [Alphaproteobacteria bacterium]|nr:MAG: hypothetical protein BroJett024_40100 [Alphaproteobacteria bacterium]